MAIVNGTSANDFIHRLGDGHLFGGNEITTVTTGADQINGDVGQDMIFGDAGNDTINGLDGNDTVVGGQGVDRSQGGVGNDIFRYLQLSDISGLAETVNGGNDYDTMDFQTYQVVGTIDLSLANIVGVEQLLFSNSIIRLTSAQLDRFEAIFGSAFQERLFLTDGGLVDLTGASIGSVEEIRGNDLVNQVVLSGVAQGQFLTLAGGNDSAVGGDGNDWIEGGAGTDAVQGGLGNDTAVGGEDADTLVGGAGGDILNGGSGTDSLIGGAGNDVFRITLVGDVTGLAETLDGGTDIDVLDFQTDTAFGAANISGATLTSVETLLLGQTELTLTAAQLGGFTGIFGTAFSERVILSGGGIADLTGAVIGAIEEFRGSAGANVILLDGVANAQFIDGLSGADSISATLGADVIEGGSGTDTLNGNDGADTIRGEQGADSLQGGIGNDLFQFAGISDISRLAETIDGGNDVDALDFQAFAAVGRVDLSAAALLNIENLYLDRNTVTLTAAQLADFETIAGTAFYERLQITAAGLVDLTNSAILAIDEMRGTSGADTFLFAAATGNITVNLLGGNDSVAGGDGNDVQLGGNGNDTLQGGAGQDEVWGQAGTDNLTGGIGADAFVFNDLSEVGLGAGRDVITDFTHGQDIIRLTNIDANLNLAGDQQFTFIGGAAFGSIAGQLRYAGGILSADLDADGTADFQIGLTGTPVLGSADFQL